MSPQTRKLSIAIEGILEVEAPVGVPDEVVAQAVGWNFVDTGPLGNEGAQVAIDLDSERFPEHDLEAMRDMLGDIDIQGSNTSAQVGPQA